MKIAQFIMVALVVLLLSGCMTSGKMYIELDPEKRGGHTKVMRIIEAGHGNLVEPGWNMTLVSYCDQAKETKVTEYEVDFEEGFGPETVTETKEVVEYFNCKDTQFRYASQPGWGPAAVGSTVTAAGTAYAGHAIGKGTEKSSDSITVDVESGGCQGNCDD